MLGRAKAMRQRLELAHQLANGGTAEAEAPLVNVTMDEVAAIRNGAEQRSDDIVKKLQHRLSELLASGFYNNTDGSGSDSQWVPPKHAKGGFACVLLDEENNIAIRLEPMRNQVDAAAWLAFHGVLDLYASKAADAVAKDRPRHVYEACRDISELENPGHSSKEIRQVMAWNDTALVRKYQEPTLEAFTRHIVKHRNRILKRSAHKGSVVVRDERKGEASTRLMTPSAWFWHALSLPVLPEEANRTEITELDRTRRVRGRELAEVLCVSPPGTYKGREQRTMRLLCSVFDLASYDASKIYKEQRAGASAAMVTNILRDVGLALRSMHACGSAHGDVKLANILYVEHDGYLLGDLPALLRATTRTFTIDPIAGSAAVDAGRRMLANDCWGLGVVGLQLMAGPARFRTILTNFKKILEPGKAGPCWLIMAMSFLHALGTSSLSPKQSNPELAREMSFYATHARKLLHSTTAKAMLHLMSRPQREVCREFGVKLARTVANHPAFEHVWKQLAYCLDSSNLARNAIAMPLSDAVPFSLSGNDTVIHFSGHDFGPAETP